MNIHASVVSLTFHGLTLNEKGISCATDYEPTWYCELEFVQPFLRMIPQIRMV